MDACAELDALLVLLLPRDSVSLHVENPTSAFTLSQGLFCRRGKMKLTRKKGRGRSRELGEKLEHLRRKRKPLLLWCGGIKVTASSFPWHKRSKEQ